jgi:probable O-glycosylation ligase (exosortase A-associated)
MLRNIFVFLIIVVGVVYAAQGPFYALLFYLWNAYFRPEQWVWGPEVREMRLSLIIGWYLVVTALLSTRNLRLNMRTGLVVLFAIHTLVCTVTSEHTDWSWIFWIDFAKVLLVSYLIVVLVTTRERIRLLLLVIAFSLGFECAKQGWAQLILNPGAQNNNIIPFLGDNNGVAVGTMMLVPVFGALSQTATRRWEKFVERFFMIGVFMRGFTTYSRGGFLAAGVLGFLTLIRSPRKFRALAVIGAMVLLVSTVMPQKFWDRMYTIVAPTGELDESAQGRLHFWRVAVRMADARPFVGVGFNGFRPSYTSYDTSRGEFGEDRSPHSVWFGLLAELGYPGLGLFVLILFLAIRTCRRVRRMARDDPSRADLGRYATAIETSLIVHAVGGTFLPGQYSEMAWHFIGIATAIYLVALQEAPSAAEAVGEKMVAQFAMAR